MKFTDDPYVKETLAFLMTREIAHYKMFEAALETIQPNFPPAVLQADPRYVQQYFNLSTGAGYTGPWNEGEMPDMGKEWQFIADPIAHVKETEGLTNLDDNMDDELAEMEQANEELSQERSAEVKEAEPEGEAQWSDYEQDEDYADEDEEDLDEEDDDEDLAEDDDDTDEDDLDEEEK